MTIKKENTACLILNNENKFLLIQRNPKDDSYPSFWELPSGGIEEGERMEDGIVREVMEETGIDISKMNIKQVDTEKYTLTKENGDIKNVVETTYTVYLDNTPKVVLSDEHVNYKWITLSQLDEIFKDKEDLIYKRIKRVFNDVL